MSEIDKMLKELDQIEGGGTQLDRLKKVFDDLGIEYEANEGTESYVDVDLTSEWNGNDAFITFRFQDGKYLELDIYIDE